MTLHPQHESRLAWRKSSHSHNDGDCVETASTPSTVAIRDSKNLTIGTFAVPPASWAHLAEALKG
jgi:uncharacterized protein DUF397